MRIPDLAVGDVVSPFHNGHARYEVASVDGDEFDVISRRKWRGEVKARRSTVSNDARLWRIVAKAGK